MSYIREARVRAQRRKSPWNLLLLPAVLVPLFGIWASMTYLAEALHAQLYAGQSLSNAHGGWPILAVTAPFFASLMLAMLIGNALVWLIPPARHALETEALARPGTSFRAAQAKLRRAAIVTVPLSVTVSLLGAVLPW